MVRVLHVLGGLNAGGIEAFLMSVYRKIDRSKVQFDFLVAADEHYFYSDEIERMGGRIFALRQSRFHPRRTYQALKGFYLSHGVKIVHVHSGTMRTLMPLLAARDADVPTRIFHSHNAYPKLKTNLDYVDALVHRLNTHRIGLATDRFACSADAASYCGFDRHGGEWRYVPNGIDVDRFAFDASRRADARAELGLAESTFLVGNIGRFSPPKNQIFLLRSFAALSRRCADSRLLLVGAGKLEDEIHNEVLSLGLEDKVIFLKNRSDTERLYAAMDVFGFPSLYEGLGIVLVEAQASGLPCVISEHIPREAVYGSNVATVPLDEGAEAWAEALLACRGAQRSEAGPADTRNAGFDIAEVASSLQEFYLGAAGRGVRAKGN